MVKITENKTTKKPKNNKFGFFGSPMILTCIGIFLTFLFGLYSIAGYHENKKQNKIENENTVRDRAKPIENRILNPEYDRQKHKITAQKNQELELDTLTEDKFKSIDGSGNSLITLDSENSIDIYISGAKNPVSLTQVSSLKSEENIEIINGTREIEIVDYNGLSFVVTDASHRNDNIDKSKIQNLIERPGGNLIPTLSTGVIQIDRAKYKDFFYEKKILFLFLNDDLGAKHRNDIIEDVTSTFPELEVSIFSIKQYIDEDKQEIRSIKSIVGDCERKCIAYTKGSNYVPYTRRMVTEDTDVYIIIPTTMEMYNNAENINN